MSESLRDRVAHVLCEFMDDDGPKGPICEACYEQADALIAAGLVVEPRKPRPADQTVIRVGQRWRRRRNGDVATITSAPDFWRGSQVGFRGKTGSSKIERQFRREFEYIDEGEATS